MKKLLSLFLMISMLFSLAGCGSSGGDSGSSNGGSAGGEKGKTLVVAVNTEPVHFNTNANDAGGTLPSANIMSGLVQLTVTNAITPDLAKDWTISDDGLTYTFNLNENIKWHDGEAFTSKDVKWTLETILKEKGMNVERLSCIKEITCPDDNTVVLQLSEPNAALVSVLAIVDIMPARIYEGSDWLKNEANQKPIGTGPFKFVEHKKGVSITLEANKDYFKGAPKMDKIVYNIIPDENTAVQAYINGEVDVLDLCAAISPAAVPSLEKIDGTKVQTMISADRQYMIANMTKEPWSNVKVRQALAYAVDRDEIVDKAHKGFAKKAEGFYTPSVEWAYTDKYKMPEKDIEKAKKLLDEAGYTPDANGVRIKGAEIVIFQFAVFSDIAKIVQANLKEIGIETTITTLEYAAWDERLNRGEYDIALIGGNHGPDPESLSVRVGKDGALNHMHYDNPELDKLLKEGVLEADVEKRAEIYGNVQKILSEDLPVLPLSEWCYIVVTDENLTGHPIENQEKAGAVDYFYVDFKK